MRQARLKGLHMEMKVNVSMILAQRIIEMFDEVGATEAERYRAVHLATIFIPDSLTNATYEATRQLSASDETQFGQGGS